MRLGGLALLILFLAPVANAHGDLAVNELEVLAIRDFEGMEDSYPWGGFEIWDVYVGEGYNESLDANGVYFKVNFAGDGTSRPPGGESTPWTVTFRFNVGDEAFERQLSHDGKTITTTFESLQWMIADGNVLQVKAWALVEEPIGKNVTDIVLVSSVGSSPRDTAPGGVHDPATGNEAPIAAPGTPMFPPLGEGRMVDAVALTGPAKFLNVSLAPKSNGTFAVTVVNPLKEQGQHVILTADVQPSWNLTAEPWGKNLDGGATTTFLLALRPDAPAGSPLAPFPIDILTDIGGRQTFYAFLDGDDVALTSDANAARSGSVPGGARDVASLPAVALIIALAAIALVRRRA